MVTPPPINDCTAHTTNKLFGFCRLAVLSQDIVVQGDLLAYFASNRTEDILILWCEWLHCATPADSGNASFFFDLLRFAEGGGSTSA